MIERVRATGTVTMSNHTRGFGFITPDDGGADVFVHYGSIEKPAGSGERPTLEEGARVSYDVAEHAKGPSAIRVRVTGYRAAPPAPGGRA